jgi:uncharacterized membrane protein
MAARPQASVHSLHVDDEPRSARALLRRLLSELSTLIRQEFALAVAELIQSLGAFRAVAVVLAGGAIALLAGFLLLLTAAVLGLAALLPPWLAALVVAVVVLAIGFGLLQSARGKLQPKVQQLERSVERAAESFKGGAS